MLYNPNWKQEEVKIEPLDEVRAALRKAAKIIERKGWTRGELQNDQGEVCLMGSVMLACYNVEWISRCTFNGADLLHYRVCRLIDQKKPDVVCWNDTQATKQEVIDFLNSI